MKLRVFSVKFWEIKSHVTDNQTISNRTDHKNRDSNQEFILCSWTNLTNTKQVEADVEANQEPPVWFSDVVIVNLWNSKPDEVHVGNPFLFKDNRVVPDAATEMDVQEHVEDKHHNFKQSFQFLTLVEVHDDSANSLHSDDFEKTQELKVTALTRIFTLKQVVKWNGWHDIEEELGALQVSHSDEVGVNNFFTGNLVDIGGSETENDIQHEDQIDQRVHGSDLRRI